MHNKIEGTSKIDWKWGVEMSGYHTEEAILQNLEDAGCSAETIRAFMADLKQGNKSEGIRKLNVHRRFLLDMLHEEQKRIDCLDYLIYELKNKKA